MKKKTAIIVYIVLLTLTLSAMGAIFLFETALIRKSFAVSSAENGYDTETKLTEKSELVSTIPGTTPEMLSYEFWADRATEEVLFTPDEIAWFNENNPLSVKYTVDKTSWRNRLYMYDLKDAIKGNVIAALIKAMYEDDFVKKTPELFVDGKEVPSGYIEGLIEKISLAQIPETVTPRYAINLNRTIAKIFPTEDYASETAEDIYFDSFISAEVMPFDGVVVLHETSDGEYSYILNGSLLRYFH